MGLIKKKTAVRTTEGGIKYICDICSSDITATVSFPMLQVPVAAFPGPMVRALVAHAWLLTMMLSGAHKMCR